MGASSLALVACAMSDSTNGMPGAPGTDEVPHGGGGAGRIGVR